MTTANVTHIRIGGYGVVEGTGVLEANLGSCLGMVIAWPQQKRYGLAHILLPNAPPNTKASRLSRYANTAPKLLLAEMEVPEANIAQLRAVMGGCAQMYDTGSECQVGHNNETSGRKALRSIHVRLLGLETGLSFPRRIRVDASTGLVSVIRMGPDVQDPVSDWRLG